MLEMTNLKNKIYSLISIFFIIIVLSVSIFPYYAKNQKELPYELTNQNYVYQSTQTTLYWALWYGYIDNPPFDNVSYTLTIQNFPELSGSYVFGISFQTCFNRSGTAFDQSASSLNIGDNYSGSYPSVFNSIKQGANYITPTEPYKAFIGFYVLNSQHIDLAKTNIKMELNLYLSGTSISSPKNIFDFGGNTVVNMGCPGYNKQQGNSIDVLDWIPDLVLLILIGFLSIFTIIKVKNKWKK